MADDSSPVSIIHAIGKAAVSRTDRPDDRVTALYETHRGGVYRFLVAQGLPPAAAQEVTQDVFVKLFMALQRGKEITSDEGWIYGVAAKSAVEHWRRDRRPVWVELDERVVAEVRSDEPGPDALASAAQQKQRVARAFMKLPKEQRMCVQLRFRGLRYRDIASIMGVAVSTASEWLSTAVERLRGAAHD